MKLFMKFLKGCLMSIGGFVLVVFVAALLLGRGGNQETNSSKSGGTSNSGTASSPTSPQSVALGTWADATRNRAIKINRSNIVTQISPNNQFMKPVESKGGKLVVIYMSLKNTGQESGNMFWSKFQLIDNQGRKYDEIEDFKETVSISTWLESQGLEKAGNQLFPGATAQTAKVFRVAPDADGLKLTINDANFNI